KLLTLLFLMLISFNIGIALAQENVEIRGSDLDGYTRLVFEWPSSISFSATKENDKLVIQFQKAGTANASSVNSSSLRNVGGLSLEQNDSGLKAIVNIAEDGTYRNFKIGKRVIVDVYDSQGTPDRNDAKSNATVSQPEQNENAVSAPSKDNLKDTTSSKAIEEQPKITGIQPHVITVSSTEAIAVAAFERAGFLWLVFDRPELMTPPVLSGANKDDFPALEKIDIEGGGVAYRMPRPEGYYLYGEGGGILWRLVMTPTPRDAKAKAPTVTDASNLLWPMETVGKVLEIEDPVVGDIIKIVTVNSSSDFSGPAREYVELETFTSPIGMAFAPRADNVKAQKTAEGMLISKPNGLAVSSARDTAAVTLKDSFQKSDLEVETEQFDLEDNPLAIKRIYDFNRWEMGGIRSLDKNCQILMSGLGVKKGAAKTEDLLTLAKLNIANDRGPEALGLLRVAANELPGIDESPEFLSLRGAAAALSSRYDEALQDYAIETLKPYTEIDYWKSFALAGVEDWVQADQVMPSDFRVLNNYPNPIKEPITLALAETALRAGKVNTAQDLLMSLEDDFSKMSLSRQSAWKYLNGELENQKGNFDSALDNWTPLLSGKDDYYRAKAGLSVTRMQLEREKITPEKAIDRLEGLRYAWRGDELESLINYRLGQVYIKSKDYLKGLSVLRNAVSIAPNSKITEEITNDMTSIFREIFMSGELDGVSPVDAVSIYEEFKELTPIGPEGDLFVQNLAEKLVDLDLLGRAAELLDHQVTHRLKGKDKAKVAIRLAAIRLLNDQPDGALAALNTATTSIMNSAGKIDDPFKAREIQLLRARALSKINRANEALASLNRMKEDKDVLKLRADIAWSAGRWDDAAKAFQKLMVSENITKNLAPSEYEANLILNRAIALNLSGQRLALDNISREYGDVMKQSNSAKLFELVTRPRKLGLLDNRESISSLISEVDLFGGFLENYKNVN
ncbi:MAG: hypothetical protein AAF244_05015, partial [Pseudomonadota bacterium]